MTPKQKKAMKHSSKLGAGAKARKNLRGKEKVGVVMAEFKRGTLHSGSGQVVKNPKQAIAIAMSEAHMSKPKTAQQKFEEKRIKQGAKRY